ncbi:MAG: M56 family metallopeptidase [Sphingomicrobium sp.]
MDHFFHLAAKSFLVAGVALLLLRLADKRSAAQRSWIAHLGLAAILLLPVASLALPAIEVQRPDFLTSAAAETPVAAPAIQPTDTPESLDAAKPRTESAVAAGSFRPASQALEAARSVDWAVWIYAAPAALLLLLTLIALGRLFALRARASVMVEPHWLSALARAQRRMGFKHGTALLTSDELPSPISWGVVRPVILLNSEATQSHLEAEAIIAHELAHVANFDWAKLLLSRVAVALFWFNPLVWALAREAHQLREEAADDAVLGADIEDTDYAKLLVGVARHQCRGLLIGAHGVAPSRSSLSRRVRRVLDSTLARGPIGRAFALGVVAGAAVLAAPLAALTLTAKPVTPTSPTGELAQADPQTPYYRGAPQPAPVSDAAEELAAPQSAPNWSEQRAVEQGLANARQDVRNARLAGADGEDISAAVANAVAASRQARMAAPRIAREVLGVTPQYVAAMRAASPQLARVGADDLVALKVQGVTAGYVHDLEKHGLRGLDLKQIAAAKIHGVDCRFLESMAAAGYPRLSFEEAVNMRIHGVTTKYVKSLQRRGFRNPSAADVIKLRILEFAGPDPDVEAKDDS